MMPAPHAHPHRHWALGLSVLLHLGAAGLWMLASGTPQRPSPPPVPERVLYLDTPPPAPAEPPPAPQPAPAPPPRPSPDLATQTAEPPPATAPAGSAYREAPAAPSAEDWALAARYTLKNSKRYRYNWGQQVRSLMGTAYENGEQGSVRLRIHIAPNGQLAQVETLWATSPAVEQRVHQAIQRLPSIPPTPNGQPLVFEKTIVFDAFTAEAPPLYKNDCEPDPPQHRNRFVWDGRSPQTVADEPVTEKLDPIAYAECLKQLPPDSIEAETASNERQQKQWASPTLGR